MILGGYDRVSYITGKPICDLVYNLLLINRSVGVRVYAMQGLKQV